MMVIAGKCMLDEFGPETEGEDEKREFPEKLPERIVIFPESLPVGLLFYL